MRDQQVFKALALMSVLSFGVAFTACSSQAPTINTANINDPSIELDKGYLLNWDNGRALEPSGLALCQGKLLMVSDDHPRNIFEIELDLDRNSTSTLIQSEALIVNPILAIP